jgi:hypothetical protein
MEAVDSQNFMDIFIQSEKKVSGPIRSFLLSFIAHLKL